MIVLMIVLMGILCKVEARMNVRFEETPFMIRVGGGGGVAIIMLLIELGNLGYRLTVDRTVRVRIQWSGENRFVSSVVVVSCPRNRHGGPGRRRGQRTISVAVLDGGSRKGRNSSVGLLQVVGKRVSAV